MTVSLAQQHDVALLDLDGVVYAGAAAVPHAVPSLRAAASAGMRLAYVTNNASRAPEVVADHLRGLGLSASPGDVVTSAQAGARLLAALVPVGSKVLAVGGPGLVAALAERGLHAVGSADDAPAAVIQGFDPGVGWPLLAEAAYALADGLPWVATNTDLTIPTGRGTAPGNGTLVAVLATTTGRTPVVAGKPEPPLMQESVERTGAHRPLVVGDRLDTDIEGADRSGLPSLLVLTGVTDVLGLLAAPPGRRPTHVGVDLRALLEPGTGPLLSQAAASAGGWRLEAVDGTVRVVSAGPRPADGIHALASLAWQAADRDERLDAAAAAATVSAAVPGSRSAG